MSKIDGKEYMILKNLKEDNCKWIFRDKSIYGRNGELWASAGDFYKNERERRWFSFKKGVSYGVDNNLFQFIQWEDEKPHNIAELIKEYEIETGMRYDFGKIKVVDIDTSKLATKNGYIYVKESEELEVKKNIEWANGEIKKVRDLLNNKRYEEEVDDFTTGVLSGLKKALEILDQLDEPETLSQEWLVEHSYNVHLLGTPDVETVAVPRDDLEGLLVPTLSEMETVEITEEQAMEWLDNNDFYCHATAETVLANAVDKGELGYYGTKYSVVEKPTIPRFIAEAIEEDKEAGCDVYDSIYFIIETNGGGVPSISDWVAKNIDKYARAWINGYTVEEQKYYVLDEGNIPFLAISNGEVNREPMHMTIYAKGRDNAQFALTEQEIKDYDPRYMTFAKPIEEFEE